MKVAENWHRLSLALGTGALSEAILATGEIKPQAPGDPSKLLSFDRAAIDQTPVAMWATVSTVALFSRDRVCNR